MKNEKEDPSSIKINQKEIVRVDRNIVVNNNFFTHFKEDECMVRTVAFYLCYAFQNYHYNEYETIDPYKLADVMGLDSMSLRKKHPDPYEKRLLGDANFEKLKASGEVTYETVLENALYQLASNPIKLNYQYKKEDGSLVKEGILFSFLTYVKKKIVKTEKTYKYFYQIKLNDFVKENLTGMFVLTHRAEFSRLTRSVAQQSLYFYLSNLKSILSNHNEDERIGYPSFDELANHCKALDQEPKYTKERINRTFKALQEKCPTLGVHLHWEKSVGGEKWKYTPIVTFDFSMHLVETPTKRFKAFEKIFNIQIKEGYESLKTHLSFEQWVRNPNKDFQIKQKIYVKAYNISFGKKNEIDIYSNSVKHWLGTNRHLFQPK